MQITVELTEKQLQWLQYMINVIISGYGLAFTPELELQDALDTFNTQLQKVKSCNQ